MARYRKVDPRIWNDAKFRGLSDNAKLTFFMLLTHPGMTALGAMRATVAGLAEEMGWSAEAFREAFSEVISKGMAEHDPKACFVGLPNFIRYNEPESPNVVKAWIGALDLLPECEQRERTVARAVAYAQGKGKAFSEALPEAFREALSKTMPYQEQEQEQEQESPSPDGEGGKPAGAGVADPCPHQEIIAAYHRLLPMGRQVREWTPARASALRSRWREKPARQVLAWWERFFTYVSQSAFLTGQVSRPGHKPFELSLDWLVKHENMAKVIEGAYHDVQDAEQGEPAHA